MASSRSSTAPREECSADPDEILVSSTTRGLLEGSGFKLEARGLPALKGLDEPELLFAVTPT